MINIIDYEAGNGESVVNALSKINYSATITDEIAKLKASKLIILPGVGSAPATMESLTKKKLLPVLQQLVVEEKKPFLGICIGYQILFANSEEIDNDKALTKTKTKTLGWLAGTVKKFNLNQVRVPQIGWNLVKFTPLAKPFLAGMPKENYFYYVNSYYALPEEKYLLGESFYGTRLGAFIKKENIIATQFHLEKSGEAGLKLLKNIVDYFVGE